MRSEPHIAALNATRVFFSTPLAYSDPAKVPSTWIVLSLVGETHEAGDLGLQQPLIQTDVWGKTKALAAALALAVQTAGRQLSTGQRTTVGTAVIAVGDVSQKRWLPDPTTNTPRYIVDLLFAMYGPEA